MRELDPQKQQQFAHEVVEKLRAAGFEAYWAGGCVRDELLGRIPKDYDVATSAKPPEIQSLFPRSIAVGAAFGVITVVGPKRAGQIEVTTFREDATYSDGRHPDSVSFSTPERDAQRRDFTINGLFYDPADQRVIDFVGGRADLERRVVRAIGNPRDRFDEDKLRMLRAVRFATTFGFSLDPQTEAAIHELAPELTLVSAERITMEMRLMLVQEARAKAVEMLERVRLLPVILPELSPSGSGANLTGDEWQNSLCALAELEAPSFPLALATLLHAQASVEQAEAIALRWKLSTRDGGLTCWLLQNQSALMGARGMPWPKLQRLMISPDIRELIELHRAIAVARREATDDFTFCEEVLAKPPEELNPKPLLSGDDLIAHGLRPGKHFQGLLEAVRNAQLEGKVRTREEALKLVEQLYTRL